jgi:hypothetical protein
LQDLIKSLPTSALSCILLQLFNGLNKFLNRT